MNTAQTLRQILVIGIIFALIGLSGLVLSSFAIAIVWACMICVALWPALLWLQKKLKNSRALATTVLMLLIVLALVLPLFMIIGSVVDQAQKVPGLIRSLAATGVPALPQWVGRLPWIGGDLLQAWQELVAGGTNALITKITPHGADISSWAMAKLGNLSSLFVQLLLILVVSGLFFMIGDKAAAWLKQLSIKIAGEKGENATLLAAHAVRAIAMGVGVTTVIQSVVSGTVMALAGVPFAALLTLIIFVLCIAQVGVIPVLVPAVIWLFWRGDIGWAVFLMVTTVGVSLLDNVLRPLLIQRSVDLPALLIFVGVLGGMLSFGLLGIFLGPVILAVTWTLIQAWLDTPD